MTSYQTVRASHNAYGSPKSFSKHDKKILVFKTQDGLGQEIKDFMSKMEHWMENSIQVSRSQDGFLLPIKNRVILSYLAWNRWKKKEGPIIILSKDLE